MTGAVPLVAHAPRILWETCRARGNLGEALQRLLLRHETLSLRLRLGGLPAAITADPKLSRLLLVSHAGVWKKTRWEHRVLCPVMEGGSIILDGDEWKEHQRAVAPTFGARSLSSLTGLVSRAARSRLANWGSSVNVSHEMRCISNEALSGYFLDGPSDHGCPLSIDDLAVRFARIEEGLEGRVVDRWGVSDRLQALLSHKRSFDGALADVTSFIRAAIDGAARRPSHTPTNVLRAVLARLPSDDSALKELRTLIAAGMTTVHLLSWLLHLVAKHPAVQERLRAAVAIDAPEESLYVNAVIHEGLRLYPPAPFLLRESEQGLFCIVVWSMHRHPWLWKEPVAFRPERWLETGPDGRERLVQSDAFIPFGAGPRVCIGKKFALIEAATVLKEVLTRFRLVVPAGPDPAVKLAVLTRPAKDVRLETHPVPRPPRSRGSERGPARQRCTVTNARLKPS
jgi:cytochrome P450